MIFQKNRKIFIFLIFSLAGVLLAITSYSEKSLAFLYFFWREPFLIFIRSFCIILFCFLILKWVNQKFLPRDLLKLIGGIMFLPVLLLPVFRCYFKVPYVFCRACPDKCPWGLSRTFFFSTFVGLNLSGRFWCTAVCPVGTFQECQARFSKKHLNLFSWLSALAYIILFLTAWLYLLTFFGSSWIESFEKGGYSWATVSLAAAVLMLATAFFIPKFWCRYFCPIGTIAELGSWFKHLFNKTKQRTA